MKNSKKIYITNSIICLVLLSLVLMTTTFTNIYVSSVNNDNLVYNGDTTSNKVSLMFNVYWGTEYLNGILETLDNYNVTTTFFVGGSWVEKETNMLQTIMSYGHEIGNHGYFHLDHSKLSYDQNKEEISTCHNLVKVYTDYDMKLFAPPSGAFNNATIDSATELGYLTIMWSKDTIDWRDKDSNLIFSRATKNLKGGDLILMHPTENTLLALPAILEYIKLNNLEVVTVSDNIGLI